MRDLCRFILVLCLALTGLAYASDSHVGVLKYVSGQVVVVRAGETLQPAPGMRLMKTDVIRSGPDSSAGVIFIDGTRLTVGASSEVHIRQYLFDPGAGKYDFNLYLKQGSLMYDSGKLGKLAPESVSVSTTRATTGVRGTRFILKEE